MGDRTRRTVLTAVGGTVVVGLAGCSQTEGSGNETTTTDESSTPAMTEGGMTETTTAEAAMVRVAHMAPDAPNVDVYVDGDRVLSSVPFGATSQYLELPPGTYPVEITAAGDRNTVVFDDDVTVESGAYTIVAAGELAEDGKPFKPLVLSDDTSDPGSDQARVRLVHVSPDAPAVDVTANGTTVFDGVDYRETATTTVPARNYTLQVRPDRETNDGEPVGSFDLQLDGGTVYTVYAAGYVTPDDDPADKQFDLVVATGN